MPIIKLHTTICFCLLLAFSFCRKKDPEPHQEEPCITTFNSTFTLDQRFIVTNSVTTSDGRYPQVFLQKQNSCDKAPSSVQHGQISLNSKNLVLFDPYFWITENVSDTISQTQQPPFTWNSGGSSDIPICTEIINDSVPVFYLSQFLPDTVSKSTSTMIQLGGKNANSIGITIASNANNSSYIRIPSTSIGHALTIPSSVSGNTTGTLTISYEKGFTKDIQGVNTTFYVLGTYRKQVFIKN